MTKRKLFRILFAILIIIIATSVHFLLIKNTSNKNIVISPENGAEWFVGKEYEIKWRKIDTENPQKISLAIINKTFGSGYRFNICESNPPYSCELENIGSFKWTIPPDDGHNLWATSSDYQIIILDNTNKSVSESLVYSKNFSIKYPLEDN